MNADKLRVVRARIKEFLEVANAASVNQDWPISGTKETGALRRASIELTRALAEFRKPS